MITQISEQIVKLISERLGERNDKGFDTYNETLDDVPFENYDWNAMAMEELLDLCQYLVKENFFLKSGRPMMKRALNTRYGKVINEMKFNEFGKDVWRTFNKKDDVKDNITNAVFGLSGEAGEVSDIFKKAWFQGHNMSREKVIDELGDVLYYTSLLADLMDSSLEEVATKNIIKRGKRYPNGFEAERSVNRPQMTLDSVE